LFTVKFVFLGNSGIAGSIGNIFSSALNNLGLSSLTSNPTSTITSGREAKIMNIQECVLTGVTVDYAPNGWAAYNDGYPVQTTLQLNFKETQILTKDKLPNRRIAENYETQTNREINRDFIKNGSGISDAVALAGLDESAAFGNQSMSISPADVDDAELGAAMTALSAEQQADFGQEYGDQVSVFVDPETGEITPLPL
jgi:hypothetical protein